MALASAYTSSRDNALSIAYSLAFDWANSHDFSMFSLSADTVTYRRGKCCVDGTMAVPGRPYIGYRVFFTRRGNSLDIRSARFQILVDRSQL